MPVLPSRQETLNSAELSARQLLQTHHNIALTCFLVVLNSGHVHVGRTLVNIELVSYKVRADNWIGASPMNVKGRLSSNSHVPRLDTSTAAALMQPQLAERIQSPDRPYKRPLCRILRTSSQLFHAHLELCTMT
jgi:hypothetical protein